MMFELDEILANNLATVVFVYGSVAGLIVSAIAARLLTYQPRSVQSMIAIHQPA